MHRMFRPWLGALFVLVGVSLCAGGCINRTTTDKDIDYISSVEAQQLVHGEKKLLGIAGTAKGVWVDPRTPTEFRAGHIPGAINVPYQNLAEDFITLKPHDILIVYGDDYNDPVADAYSKRLIELGHKDVRTLNGGLHAWKADGNPIETGDGTPAP